MNWLRLEPAVTVPAPPLVKTTFSPMAKALKSRTLKPPPPSMVSLPVEPMIVSFALLGIPLTPGETPPGVIRSWPLVPVMTAIARLFYPQPHLTDGGPDRDAPVEPPVPSDHTISHA
ncbi:MAG: hypothetical protein RMK64_03330 [Rhodovarius sp.]|nr:hypothetical protein [Rhodovarius sp.]MDW8313981.1 hypothetical protein [Rhodovarius sp.]